MEPEGSDNGVSKLPAPLSGPESQSWSNCIPQQYQQVKTRTGCIVSLWSSSVYPPAPPSDSKNLLDSETEKSKRGLMPKCTSFDSDRKVDCYK
ncbi:hypothetical protein EVAR_84259_1 [Eumeta japonica]|uniref:Uncharacterized protein n=1 Tax=Eumeta variegata TaxID=151549 RepID=A0A4C1WUI3_EUMVA|nr:hypothetical protein EVAR_84259_1 [Eumeta japonica]